MNQLQTSILALTEAIRSMGRKNTIPKAKPEGRHKSGKTRRGATHVVNPTFKSRNRMGISPAQYRQKHLGVTHVRSDSHK